MSDYLPPDVIGEILVRLPIRSLIKCSTVCKSWKSLIESSAFIHTHLRRQNDDANLLLVKVVTRRATFLDHYLLHNPETGGYANLINPSLLFEGNQSISLHFDVRGTCNGLICMSSQSHLPHVAIIWNPSIRRLVILPRPRLTVKSKDIEEVYAFGFDMPTNDYKVLRIMNSMRSSSQTPFQVEVFSLARGCWKCLTAAVIPNGSMVEGHVFLNGALHWFQYGNRTRGQGRDNFIITFDMYNEIFCEMVLPNALTTQERTLHMLRYGESLAIVEIADCDWAEEATFHVWVMCEYGVVESWNLLYTLLVPGYPSLIVKPFGFTKNGGTLVNLRPFGLAYVNRNGRLAGNLTITIDDEPHFHWCCFADSFIQSLVLLGQANAISY